MEKQVYTLAQIVAMPVDQVLTGLEKQQFSILEAAHSNKLRAEMKGCGLFCRAVLKFVGLFAGKEPQHRAQVMRRRLARMIAWLAPIDYSGRPERKAECLVFGFNHPSLGEIIRFVYVHLALLPKRTSLFPVNLPWYEMLAPSAPTLKELGIMITPILTPSCMEKVSKNVNKTERESLESLRQGFTHHYNAKVAELAVAGDAAIWIAPSATRQATVFASEREADGLDMIRPQTMGLIAAMLAKTTQRSICFVPVAVAPSKKCGRGLNLLKDYSIMFGPAMDWKEVEELRTQRMTSNRGRRLEYEFRLRIAQTLRQHRRGSLITPPRSAP